MEDMVSITLHLIPMDLSSGADETATMAAAAERRVCVPVSPWERAAPRPAAAAAAAAAPLRVPAHRSSPPAPGHHGV